MANTFQVKRSSVAGKVPLVGDLSLGEIAINTTDGKLFIKKNVSGVESIVDVTAGGVTANDILAQLLTVDGAGSGLDADLLDGQQGSYYLDAANLSAGILPSARLSGSYAISITGNAATATTWATARTLTIGSTGKSVNGSANVAWTLAEIGAAAASHGHTAVTTLADGFMSAADKTKLDGIAAGAQVNTVTSVAGKTGAVTLVKGDVGLGLVDNTADSSKSVASAAVLTTARTIALSGAATGTATSFNGSANISIAVTGLNASNLDAGTVPDARLTGTYSGFTHKLDGANTVFTTPNSGSTTTAARTVYGLAEYKSAAAAQVGAIVFIAPNTTSTIMHQLEIAGMLYNQNIVSMTVQGYRTTAAWADVRKISTGTVDVQTRWAVTPDGKNCLILGDVATSWSYPHFSILRAMFSHSGVVDSYCSGWTVAVVTDLSLYTNVTATIADSTMVGSVSGNAATATTLQTARTINGTSFNGSANITTANWGTARTLSFTGDATGSASVNGSVDVATALTLANSGVTAGTYGGNNSIPSITVDAKGRVTAVSTVTPSGTYAISISGSSASTTGNAATATTLQTARTIALSGDVTGSVSFNGSANVTAAATLASSGVTAGTYTNATVTVDAKGRVTAASSGAGGNFLPLTGGTLTGGLAINYISPTITFQDTDHNTGFVHVNSNLMYVLRGGINATTWTQVNGQWPFIFNLTDNSATCGGAFTAVGDIVANSDIRLKTCIEVIPDALSKVLALRGVTFKRKDDELQPDRTHTGVIAQEVEKVLPEAVTGDDIKSVAYGNMVGLLIEAIKELSAKVERLEAAA